MFSAIVANTYVMGCGILVEGLWYLRSSTSTVIWGVVS